MMLWKTAGRCAVCTAALLLASFPLLAQKEHAAAPAAKAGAAAGKSDANGKPSAAPAPGATEPPAPQPQGPQAAVGEFQPVLHAQGAKIATCMDTIVGESASVIDAPHTAISSWSTAAPKDNVFVSIVGLN
jgi:putative intracellular protease/amidase